MSERGGSCDGARASDADALQAAADATGPLPSQWQWQWQPPLSLRVQPWVFAAKALFMLLTALEGGTTLGWVTAGL